MELDFSEWSGKASLCRDPEDETNTAMGISGAECSSRENIKCKAPCSGIFKEIMGSVGYSQSEHCPMGSGDRFRFGSA